MNHLPPNHSIIKFLFWNTRGLNARPKQLDVKNLLAKHNCNFIAVLETKIQLAQAQNIAHYILPNSSFHINPSGRIFILWNPDSLQIQITAESTQFCNCEITHPKYGSSMDITAVYASNDQADKSLLLGNLTDLKRSSGRHNWIVGVDFNEVRYANEKIGGCRPNLKQLHRFNNSLLACDLANIKSTGHTLSWSNKQDQRISSRLDRVLGNHHWISNYPNSYVHYLAEGISDHSPLLLHQAPVFATGPKPFKFFHMWTLYPDFLEMVAHDWAILIWGSPLFVLAQKLKRLKGVLKLWNLHSFGSVHRRLQETRQQLETSQASLHQDPSNASLIL
ncbi:hypothetical protein QJS04_geneDACA020954 [Acorus gramineus]|uniref:Endonuclease/exonuclease/phosphatase domain-containing protein n=1 Tax=Acorus gramineus TaxID=55184 RepID=A0AAV9B211_ACOGR|nr:hypothetical protein QJS04_geneDACA020954 [Acorus gramineus]